MGSVVRFAGSIEMRPQPGKTTTTRGRSERGGERRFRYPGPDAVSEISCQAPRRHRRRDSERDVREAG
jgi:hypothetical protein